MGHLSIAYGCFTSPTFYDNSAELIALNARILAELPEEDGRPPLTRDMFGEPSHVRKYGCAVTPFAFSYGTLEEAWGQWLEKFEALLRRLYWERAEAHLITELVGDHHYRWKVTGFEGPEIQGLVHPLDPVYQWDFSGGPRDFDDYFHRRPTA